MSTFLNLDLTLRCGPSSTTIEDSSAVQAPRACGSSSNDPAPNDLKKDLIFLLLQFLDEENYSETIHKLEKESRVYFNMKHFEDAILSGDWEKAEGYISAFININNNNCSQTSMIFFHLWWHKYFESIIRGEKQNALDILNKELKAFQPNYPQLFKEMAQYITTPSYMENPNISLESYVKLLRVTAISEIKKLIVSHPLLRDKLEFPNFTRKRLRALINQSYEGSNLLGDSVNEK